MGLIESYLISDAIRSPNELPTSNLGKSLAYVRRHWETLTRFTEDASIPIDNNDCEQLVKRVATVQKNWQFKGPIDVVERFEARRTGRR